MKKILFILIFISASASYSLCPVDYNSESICTNSDFDTNFQPQFQNPNSNKFSGNKKEIQPLQPENILGKSQNIKMQYDSSCQFGTCLQDTNNTNNKSR